MSHIFDITDRHKLDSKQRRQLLPASDVLRRFEISPGEIVADIGCGIGYFTLPAAVAVGKNGKVFALDISEVMLSEVIERAKIEEIYNIATIKNQDDHIPLESNSVHVAFLAFVLHEINDHSGMLKEVYRILKQEGRVAIIEWKKKETPMGPPIHHRLAKEYMKELLAATGFAKVEDVEIGDCFDGLIAKKRI